MKYLLCTCNRSIYCSGDDG